MTEKNSTPFSSVWNKACRYWLTTSRSRWNELAIYNLSDQSTGDFSITLSSSDFEAPPDYKQAEKYPVCSTLSLSLSLSLSPLTHTHTHTHSLICTHTQMGISTFWFVGCSSEITSKNHPCVSYPSPYHEHRISPSRSPNECQW